MAGIGQNTHDLEDGRGEPDTWSMSLCKEAIPPWQCKKVCVYVYEATEFWYCMHSFWNVIHRDLFALQILNF